MWHKARRKKVARRRNFNVLSEREDSDFNYFHRIMFELPDLLKKERLCRNLTQEELSREMGASRSTISLCERGENVTLRTIQDYVRTLKGIDLVGLQYKERARPKANE